jgi:hypothetical protein
MRGNGGGVNLIKIYCKHIYKYHHVSLMYNYYMPIKKKEIPAFPEDIYLLFIFYNFISVNILNI